MDLALRPMSTSQVLDRTFYLYRNNFVLFAGIAILTPALRLIAMLIQLKIFGPMVMPQQPEDFTPQFFQALFVRVIVGFIVGTIIYLFGTSLASGATAYAVSMVHLGKTTSIAESYREVSRIFGRIVRVLLSVLALAFGPFLLLYLVLIGMAVGVAMMGKNNPGSLLLVMVFVFLIGGLAILGATVWMIYAFCRYALAIPACTLEKLPAKQALKRSRFLTNGAKGKIFGISFLTIVLGAILTYALQMPALLASNAMIFSAKTQFSIAATIWIYIAEFLGGTVAGPVVTIALVLVYYDQRVRKEAFDLQYMMDAMGNITPPPPPPNPAIAPGAIG
ncbi:MAG TPA: glycerophosphoryl diester phosphodiesterase membrane domain-containing protein [Candidatus Angelobacter sp.]|nr:glycerophosphoryl diester phosphodiesterase membrane domain-containing protein [Candidatus Angelobacter sp.]